MIGGRVRSAARWRRALVSASVIALVLATVGALVTRSTPAVAALRSPIPMNEFEEPTYDFTDDNALFAFVLSDIRGGRICVVAESVTDPAAGSCDSPAWGSPNAVVGIGTVITLLEAPSLVTGNYRLLTEDSEGTSIAVSEVFSVTACTTCSRDFALDVVREWKARADDMRKGLQLTCVAFAVKDVADQVTAARGKVKKATDRADSYQSGQTGFVGTVVPTIGGAVGGALGFAFPSFDVGVNAGSDKALEILHDLSCAAGAMYQDIVNDPPDPAYATVAPARFADLPPTTSPSLEALLRALDRQAARAESSLTAYERFLGADLDGATAASARQAGAAASETFALLTELRASAAALRAHAAELEGAGLLGGPVATASEWAQIAEVYGRVASTGFTADETAALQGAGLTPAQIDAVRTHFQVPLAGFDPSLTLAQHLRALATTIDGQIAGFDAFAREASAVSARRSLVPGNTPPVASFTASPSTGAAPLVVSFDGRASTDAEGPVASYAWDFGDGGTATGATASHTYPTNGAYIARLTVTDGGGLSDTTTRTIVVAPVGPAPACTVSWSSPIGGSWNTAANWTPARVPTATDVACIDDGNVATSLVIDVSIISVRGVVNAETVEVSSSVSLSEGGVVSNSGVWSLGSFSGVFGAFGGVEERFVNSGRLVKTGTGPSSISGVRLDSTGAVEVSGSDLVVDKPGVMPSTVFSVVAPASLRLSLDAGSSPSGVWSSTGTGAVSLSGVARPTVGAWELAFPAGGLAPVSMTFDASRQPITNSGVLPLSSVSVVGSGFENAGTVEVSSSVSLSEGGVVSNSGVWSLGSLAGVFGAFGGVEERFVNSGRLVKTGTGPSSISGVRLDNTGTVDVSGSTLTITTTSQVVGTALVGGTWTVHDALLNIGGTSSLTTIGTGATVVLDGPAASLQPMSALARNDGSLALSGGSDLSSSASVVSTGTLRLGPGSTLAAAAFTTTGTVVFEVAGGPATGAFGAVSAPGVGLLGGIAQVEVASSYTPDPSDVFTLGSFGSRVGTFAEVRGITPNFVATYTASRVQINRGGVPPVAVAGPDLTVDESTPGTVVVLDGSASSDADGRVVSYAWTSVPPLPLLDASTSIARFVARDDTAAVVSLRVCDDTGQCVVDTVQLTVRNVAPTATIAVPAAAFSGDPVTVTVGVTDAGELDTLSATVTWGDGTTDTIASATSGARVHTYPAAGTFTVEYCVRDDDGGASCTSGRVVVTNLVNLPPVAVADAYVVRSNTTSVPLYLMGNDTDPDFDPLSVVTSTTTSASGGSIECVTTSCIYTPLIDFSGSDSFTYVVTDGRGGTSTGRVDLTVLPNGAPVALDDAITVRMDSAQRIVAVLANDTDPDGDPMGISGSDGSSVRGGSVGCSSGECRYTPPPGYLGSDSFTYTVSDGRRGSSTAVVVVSVVANRPPVVVADRFTLPAVASPQRVAPLVNDSDPDLDPLTVVSVTQPPGGSVVIDTDPTAVVFTSDGTVSATTFNYTASDGLGGLSTSTVTIDLGVPSIESAGPLTRVRSDADLRCYVEYSGDAAPQFYGGWACGTYVAVGPADASTTYGPRVPAGDPGDEPYVPIRQSVVRGAGTAADPYRIEGEVRAGSSGVRIRQQDRYVVGDENYRTDVTVMNDSTSPQEVVVYRAADCFLQGSDVGSGAFDPASGAVACVSSTGRIEQWYPLTPGSRHYEGSYSQGWQIIRSGADFPDQFTTQTLDNGAGLSWRMVLAPGEQRTVSHLTVFSPLGIVPVATSATADPVVVAPGGSTEYTVRLNNANVAPIELAELVVTLPDGGASVQGTSAGLWSVDPVVTGRVLRWSGPIVVPQGESTLTFRALLPGAPGTYTIDVAGSSAATTVVGTIATAAVVVEAVGVEPVALIDVPADAVEGIAFGLDGTRSNDQDGSVVSYHWTASAGTLNDPTSPTPTLTVADDGPVAVTLVVTDDGGRSSAPASITIPVANANPSVVTAGAIGTVGVPVTISASYTDSSPVDTHGASISWGDGSSDTNLGLVAGPISAAHAYVAPGRFTVQVCVVDDDRGIGCASAPVDVTLANVAPVAVASGPDRVDEGASVDLSGMASNDPDGAVVAYRWATTVGSIDDPTSPTPRLTGADDGEAVVTLEVADDDGARSSTTVRIVVVNVAPTVEALVTDSSAGRVALDVVFRDPSSLDTHEATVDWGDGTPTEVQGRVVSPFGVDHAFAETGTYPVRVCVVDDDRGAGCAELLVSVVVNRVPVASIVAPADASEGSTVAVSGAASTDPDGRIVGYRWTASAGILARPTSPDAALTVLDDGPVVLTLTVVDDAGASTTTSAVVTGTNVAPIVAVTVGAGATPSVATARVSFLDAGTADTHRFSVDWGDGTTATTVAPARSPVDAVHTYAAPGIYRITVTVTDDDGGVGTATTIYTVTAPPPPVTCSTVLGEATAKAGGWAVELDDARAPYTRSVDKVEVTQGRKRWETAVASVEVAGRTATIVTSPLKDGTVLRVVVEDNGRTGDRFGVEVRDRAGRVVATTNGLVATSTSSLAVTTVTPNPDGSCPVGCSRRDDRDRRSSTVAY